MNVDTTTPVQRLNGHDLMLPGGNRLYELDMDNLLGPTYVHKPADRRIDGKLDDSIVMASLHSIVDIFHNEFDNVMVVAPCEYQTWCKRSKFNMNDAASRRLWGWVTNESSPFNPSRRGYLIIPFCTENHWYVIIAHKPVGWVTSSTVTLLDSMPSYSRRDEVLNEFERYVPGDRWNRISVDVLVPGARSDP